MTKQVLKMETPGRRQPGRPKRRWMDCIEEDILEKNLTHRLYMLEKTDQKQ